MRVKLDKVCKRIYAGGDVPKDRYSTVKTAEYAIPIYANAEKDNGLYGYTDTARENELSITVAARGTIGFTAIRREPFLPVVRLITVVPDLSTVSERYLYYALRNCKPAFSGTSIPQLTVPDIKKNEIELYSLSVQETIADKLDAVGRIIELRQQQLQKLDELVKARFVEMFGNPVVNNKGWNVSDLGQLTIKIGSGATPKGGKEAYQTDGFSLIRSMNVHNGKFEYKELAHISDEQAARLENVAVEENDVLLNITGASVARSCVVPTNVLPARVNQHVCIIRCKDSIMPDFINSLLIDDNYQDLLWSIAGSGATREAITKQQVESLQIILPPISKQEEFSKFINRVDKSKLLQFFCFPI